MPIPAHPDAAFLGLDVHKDSISAGVLNPGCETADVEKIFNDDESIRRPIGRFPGPARIWACYYAGPTGCDLARLLVSLGGALCGGRPLDDPQGAGRQGQDRHPRLPPSGPSASGRKAGGDPGRMSR